MNQPHKLAEQSTCSHDLVDSVLMRDGLDGLDWFERSIQFNWDREVHQDIWDDINVTRAVEGLAPFNVGGTYVDLFLQHQPQSVLKVGHYRLSNFQDYPVLVPQGDLFMNYVAFRLTDFVPLAASIFDGYCDRRDHVMGDGRVAGHRWTHVKSLKQDQSLFIVRVPRDRGPIILTQKITARNYAHTPEYQSLRNRAHQRSE